VSTARLGDGEEHPVHLYVRALDAWFHQTWLDWEPETLQEALLERLSKPVPREVFEGLMAIKALRGNPAAFHQELTVFENTVLALNGLTPDPDTIQVATPAEIEAAFAVLERITYPHEEFSRAVTAYVRAACVEAGQYAFPPRIAFFEPPERKPTGDQIRALAAAPAQRHTEEDMPMVQADKLRVIAAYVTLITEDEESA